MRLFSRFVLSASMCISLGFSGIVSGIAVVIDDEPITLYEVYKYSQSFKISRKEAVDVLVRQKLEDAQIRKFNISADMFEVDDYIQNLATQNGMSVYEFTNMLKKQNIEMSQYRDDLKTKIKREKLYQRIYSDKLNPIDDTTMKNFYDNNPQEFVVAQSFDVSIYSSQNPQDLQAITKNPMLRPDGVEVQDQNIQAGSADPRLLSALNSTQENTFTQVMNIEGKATIFFVKKKNDVSTLEYEKVKNSIYQALESQQRKKAIDDYFEELKASANITVVRNPT